MNKIGIAIIMVALIAVGAVFAVKSNHKATSPTTSTSVDSTTPSPSPSPSSSSSCPTAPANTLSYCNGSFNTLTVASGATVTFKNDSNDVVQIDSDPHPAHTNNIELNIGILQPGQSKTAKLTTKGVWGIHNHLNPDQTGRITVQ